MLPSITSTAPRAHAIAPLVRGATCALALVSLAGTLPAASARAAVHVCAGEAGTTVYQDRPCRRTAPNAVAAAATRAPVGMHDSWFERPAGTDVVARCDDVGCRCDGIARPFDGGLALAVADALYLDGAWHRHEAALAGRDRALARGLPADDVLRRRVDEAACDIVISQDILRTHARGVLADLRRRTREAEERGYDDGRACDGGDTLACGYLDALTLYHRIVADLAALRAPRATGGPTDGTGDFTGATRPARP